MATGSLAGDQRGFTLIEVLVAITLLVIGVLGTMALVDSSNAQSSQTTQRGGATNLARETIEGGRSIPYAQLKPVSVVSQLQTLPGLANASPGGSWTVKRRGVTYSLTVTLCSVDDPKDGYGSHAGATYCPDSTSTGTADPQPEDLKRLMVDVAWTRNGREQAVRQAALIASEGGGGPAITALVALAPSGPPAAPVISSSAVSSVAFKATAPAGVSSVVWSVDGVDRGNAMRAANGTDWTFDLALPIGLSDGGYEVSVRTVDARGVSGPSFAIPLKLIRSQPAAPSGLVAGPNTVFVDGSPDEVIELAWLPNPERNVIGYRVFDAGGALVCPADLQTLDTTVSCIDRAATGGNYAVAALYRDAAGAVAEGPRSTVAGDKFARTYYFQKTTANTTDSTKCLSSDRERDMAEAYSGLDPEEFYQRVNSSRRTLSLCSPAFAAASTMQAGTTTVRGYVSNTAGSSCNITAKLLRNGTTSLGTSTITVPPFTANTLRTWSFSSLATSLASGDRINLHLAWQQVRACDDTSLFYGGTVNRSSVTMPGGASPAPDPVTNLSASSPGDGTTALSWSPPAGGSAVSFYRIYRDGIDYTRRLDTAGDPLDPTYVDTETGGTSHTYYVTAVGVNLSESTMVGPVTR